MVDMGSRSPDPADRRRVARTRERGMRSVSRVTRAAVAASLAATAVFSAIAAIGFSGRASASTSSGSSGATSARGTVDGQRVALPPTGEGGALTAPLAPPISQPVPAGPPVTSGGS